VLVSGEFWFGRDVMVVRSSAMLGFVLREFRFGCWIYVAWTVRCEVCFGFVRSRICLSRCRCVRMGMEGLIVQMLVFLRVGRWFGDMNRILSYIFFFCYRPLMSNFVVICFVRSDEMQMACDPVNMTDLPIKFGISVLISLHQISLAQNVSGVTTATSK
jgi:hypothetical protein